jgi:cytochrome c-type biogenesis protein CcmH
VKTIAVLIVVLVVAPVALAKGGRPSLDKLESEIVCPVCKPETLDQSTSAVALRMKAFIKERIAAGDSEAEIKSKLVAQFGEQVLAAPPRKGFNLLAWWLPIAGIVAGAGALAYGAWRWSRSAPGAEPLPAVPLEPELERRLDEELARFDG